MNINEGDEQRTGITRHEFPNTKRRKKDDTHAANEQKSNVDEDNFDDEIKGAKEEIKTLWQNAKDDNDVEKAVARTLSIVNGKVQGLVSIGLEAFHNTESLTIKCSHLQDEIKELTTEIERLRSMEKQSGTSQANLFRALDQARSQVRDNAQAVVVETRMRAEIHKIMTERDEAIGQANDNKRNVELLQEKIQDLKTKYSRITQEKKKLEREVLAAQRIAKSSGGGVENNMVSTTSDSGNNKNAYYTSKITELNERIQSMNAIVAEKNRQIDEMRHQMDRTMSQNSWVSSTTDGHHHHG